MPLAPLATTPRSTSPLTDAYGRLGEVLTGLRITEGPPPEGAGWVRAAQLAACAPAGGAALDAHLAWEDTRIRRDHGRPARPDVVATFGLHRYAWAACLLFTVPWFLHGRVPRLSLDDVSFRARADGTTHMTVRQRGFACLSGDPAARLPEAIPVRSEAALRTVLRGAVAGHLRPLLNVFGPRMRRGPRALWGMVVDEVSEGLWYVGHMLGEEDRAVAELAALLPGGTPPYAGGSGFRQLACGDGESLRTRDRVSCCLYYTLRPEDTCVTCPRTGDADRISLLGRSR